MRAKHGPCRTHPADGANATGLQYDPTRELVRRHGLTRQGLNGLPCRFGAAVCRVCLLLRPLPDSPGFPGRTSVRLRAEAACANEAKQRTCVRRRFGWIVSGRTAPTPDPRARCLRSPLNSPGGGTPSCSARVRRWAKLSVAFSIRMC